MVLGVILTVFPFVYQTLLFVLVIVLVTLRVAYAKNRLDQTEYESFQDCF